jgi:hypothetical protein
MKTLYVRKKGLGAEKGMEMTPKQMAKNMMDTRKGVNKMRKMVGLKPLTDYSKQIKKLR